MYSEGHLCKTVTGLKRSEEHLRNSEEHLRNSRTEKMPEMESLKEDEIAQFRIRIRLNSQNSRSTNFNSR